MLPNGFPSYSSPCSYSTAAIHLTPIQRHRTFDGDGEVSEFVLIH